MRNCLKVILVGIPPREDATARPMAAPTSALRARLGQTPGPSVKRTVVRLQLYHYQQTESIDGLSFAIVAPFFAHHDGLVSALSLVPLVRQVIW